MIQSRVWRRERKARSRIRHDQRGFTLVELLVGMAAGLVVASSLFTILDVTLRQTTRTFSRVDATQRARTALETIGNEMRSSCVENRVVPIHEGSTANSVSFWSAYGNGATLTPVKHTITYNSGTLTDATYPVDAGNPGFAPNWNPSTTASSNKTLLTNVAQSGSTPVFQYYSLASGSPSLLSVPLSESNSEQTTEVRITLVVKPAGGTQQNTNLTPNTVSNSVLLRLTPIPGPGTPNATFRPCE